METLIKFIPYATYRRYLLGFQIVATVLVCLPVFLSIFIYIGLPHFFFLILMALMGDGHASLTRRVLHVLMLLYYGALLWITLGLWPDIMSNWRHADTIDFLIQAQMILLPLVLTIQLGLLAFEWMYPVLFPHERILTSRKHSS